ncbi:MAG: dihydroorotate dehydrogenase [Oscillochloris sp.]|nr:dihydroorotate dehydrogenase [Oscillochloris sp.]
MIDLAPNNPHSLSIATPLIAAAGALGFGVEYGRQLGLSDAEAAHGLGALITRSISCNPQRVRPLPQLIPTAAGVIYRGAEHNPGLRAVQRRYAPTWAGWALPVIVSIFGADANELVELAGAFEGVEGVCGFEVSLALHGIETPLAAQRLLAPLRAASLLPLFVKLPGEARNLPELACAVADVGVDALALIDGLPGRAPAADGSIVTGRLYGPAIFPFALQALEQVREAVTLPLIGMGGVATTEHVRALLAAGATAIALGSALLADPQRAGRIAEQLALRLE